MLLKGLYHERFAFFPAKALQKCFFMTFTRAQTFLEI